MRGRRERTPVALVVVHRPSLLHGGVGFRTATLDALGSHPHVLRVLGLAADWQGDQCLLTEWAPLGSLDALLGAMASAALAAVGPDAPAPAPASLTAWGAGHGFGWDGEALERHSPGAGQQEMADFPALAPAVGDAPLLRASEQICAALAACHDLSVLVPALALKNIMVFSFDAAHASKVPSPTPHRRDAPYGGSRERRGAAHCSVPAARAQVLVKLADYFPLVPVDGGNAAAALALAQRPAPPEVERGLPWGLASDVFALGRTLSAMWLRRSLRAGPAGSDARRSPTGNDLVRPSSALRRPAAARAAAERSVARRWTR